MVAAFRDLRDFIDRLLREFGKDEVRAIDGAHWNLEMGCLSELVAEKEGPALLFDTVKDFSPIIMIGTSPRCVVVHPSLPVPLAVRSETRLIPEPGFLRLPLGLLLVFHFS